SPGRARVFPCRERSRASERARRLLEPVERPALRARASGKCASRSPRSDLELPIRWLAPGGAAEIGCEPLFALRERAADPSRIVLELIAADPIHVEVVSIGVGAVETAHRGGGQHGETLGEGHADFVRPEQREESLLRRVIGASGVAEGRSDATILLGDQVFVLQALVLVTPLAAGPSVEILG